MRLRPRLLPLSLTLLAGLASSPALARPLIVVLAFGGEQGTEIRDALVGALAKKYEVVHGQKLLAACDQLGITMSRGKNLATAAASLGAVAVVGGTLKEGHLVLAVYSGKTGQPLATGSVPFGGQITRPALGKALVIILKGLNKAPKKVAGAGAAVAVGVAAEREEEETSSTIRTRPRAAAAVAAASTSEVAPRRTRSLP